MTVALQLLESGMSLALYRYQSAVEIRAHPRVEDLGLSVYNSQFLENMIVVRLSLTILLLPFHYPHRLSWIQVCLPHDVSNSGPTQHPRPLQPITDGVKT